MGSTLSPPLPRPREIRRECTPTDVRVRVGTDTEMDARVLDVSTSGVRLRLGTFLKPGTTISFRLKALSIFGAVRYCRPINGRVFDLGIEITAVDQSTETES